MSINLDIIGSCVGDKFYCDTCKYPLITNADFRSSAEHGVCNDCYMEFVEGDIDNWKNGNKPEKKKVDGYLLLKRQINERKVKL
mgnify:CR=1 FL=1|tara:strand:- start:510 stop:761 length:252 start_codon:yes stop_codon:yes gene_type:complete